MRGHTRQQRADAEQFHRLIERYPALRHRYPLLAVFQVAADGEVGKQAGFLEHITQRAFVGGQKYPLGIILPDLAIDRQEAVGCPLQAGHATQQGGLAGAGMAEQGGHPARRQFQVHLQAKARVAVAKTGDNAIGSIRVDAVHASSRLRFGLKV